MPLQKKKKKKPAKAKNPPPTTKITNIVRVNVGDTKPKPRRRRPAKKKDAAFSFGGGGGGGSGLAPVVQAPQVTQDVLQESKELRRIVGELKTSPQQQTLLGMEQGGQNETQLLAAATQQGFGNIARIMVAEKDDVTSRVTNLEGVFRGEAARIKEQTAEASNKAERTAVDTQQRLDKLHDLATGTSHGFIQTAELIKDIGRRQMRQSPLDKAGASETDDEDDPSTVQADDPAPTLTPGRRGKAITEAQKVQILNKIRDKNSVEETATILGINVNTVKKIAKDMGGAKDIRKTPNPFA
tara:strand:+ start:968 stop:1861 length:894 start_codon:yes stop_codon:yes gene_type:complete